MSEVRGIVNILLVDDRQENLTALEFLLKDETTRIFKALSAREALELLLQYDFAMALVDVQMPEINGFELAELMRGKEKTKAIPIVFVTAGAIDPRHTFQGYEAGAVDFLYKPLDPRVVRSKVRVFREMEQQKMVIRSQLETLSQALRTREEFLSIASHELKTPVTSLKLQLQMARRNVKPEQGLAPSPEKLAKVLDTSTRQLDKLTRLIDDLLDVSRIQAGKLAMDFTQVDLGLLTHEVLDRFADQLQLAGCQVELVEEDAVFGYCDAFRAEQVLVNLISNVIKYAPGSPMKIAIEKDGDRARLTVKDSGIGIPEDKLETIFRRFERIAEHPGVSGLGLGLFIVHQIMALHRGTISVTSHPGMGATFVAEFPAHGPARDKTTPAASAVAG